MKKLTEKIKIRVDKKLYLRDPDESDLGRRIITESIILIDKIGFESFTFKKLAKRIRSTETSIYRYFENKHRLLLYLVSWYWNWIEYRIEISTSNIHLPEDKLKAGLRVITDKKSFDSSFAFVDEEALHRIVIAELDKTYLTKDVDRDNQEGLFGGFKSLCNKIANLISDVGPEYPFPNSLASTIVLAAKQQLFFSSHLPWETVKRRVRSASQT